MFKLNSTYLISQWRSIVVDPIGPFCAYGFGESSKDVEVYIRGHVGQEVVQETIVLVHIADGEPIGVSVVGQTPIHVCIGQQRYIIVVVVRIVEWVGVVEIGISIGVVEVRRSVGVWDIRSRHFCGGSRGGSGSGGHCTGWGCASND